MKKFLVSVAVLTVCLSVSLAADFKSQYLWRSDVTSFVMPTTTGVTNGYVGILFTNAAGTGYYTTNLVSTNALMMSYSTNLLTAGVLWSLSDGSPPLFPNYNATTNWNTTVSYVPESYVTISGKFRQNTEGDTGNIEFIVVPCLPDGTPSTSGTSWTFAVNPGATGVTPVYFITNVPMSKFIGSQSLAIKSIYNASSTTVRLWDVRLNGFVP